MISDYKKFLKNLSILTLISGLIYFLFFIKFKEYYLNVFLFVVIFFYILTSTVHYFLLKASLKKFAKFSVNFMLTTSAKLVIYIFFMVLYLLFFKQNAIPFILFFFTNYLVFTIFEIISITKIIKSQKEN